MKFKKFGGREADVNITKYLIDWEDDSLSIFQRNIKKFLLPFWRFNVVVEELPLAGLRLRLDFCNLTKRIAVECDGGQHIDPKHYYNNKSPEKWRGQIKRDLKKDEWCILNNIILVRINEHEQSDICKEWFKEKYNINL